MNTDIALRDEMSVPELVGQVATIQQAMSAVMRVDEHFGVIPGTQKPTLLKAGAEKLCLLFRLAPSYTVEKHFGPGSHLTVTVRCDLTHITSGAFVGSGEAMCSTQESKYAWRKGSHGCPNCGESAIIKGKEEYGGGWLCWRKQGGCGSTWPDNSPEGQQFAKPVDRVPNEDLADVWNTVVKIGCKRALVGATLGATAASDIFTQDIEDLPSSAVVRGRPVNTQTGEVIEETPVPFDSSAGTVPPEPPPGDPAEFEDVPFDPDTSDFEPVDGEPAPDEGDFEPTNPDDDIPFTSTAKPPIDEENVGGQARASLLRATIASARTRGVELDGAKLVQIALSKASDGRSVFAGFEGSSLEDFDEKQTKKALEWVQAKVDEAKAAT